MRKKISFMIIFGKLIKNKNFSSRFQKNYVCREKSQKSKIFHYLANKLPVAISFLCNHDFKVIEFSSGINLP